MNIAEQFKQKVDEIQLINLPVNSNYLEVGKSIGYEFTQSSSSSNEVSKYIYKEIKRKLQGNDIDNNQFDNLRKQLLIEYFFDTKNGEYVKYIEVIRDATRELNSYVNIGIQWDDVLILVSAYGNLRAYDPLANIDDMYLKEKAIAHSIKYLNTKGFETSLINGNVIISNEVQKKIATALDVRFKRLGTIGINAIMNGLKPLFNSKSNRYFFQNISSEALIPWGYLFKLSLKHLQYKKRKVGHKKDLIELVELARNYTTTLNVQEFSQYESMIQRPDTILDKIQKLVIGDQIYAIPQVNCIDILDITRFIFSRVEDESLNLQWKLDEYMEVAEVISSFAKNNTPTRFSTVDVFSKLNNKIPLAVIEKILVNMSHHIDGINNDYFLPSDSQRNNQNFKPLINFADSSYLFLDSNLFSFGFYEVVSSQYRNAGVKDSVIGDILEEFISNKFTSSGISFLTGEKYKISKAQQKLLSTHRAMGECDFIVATDEVVFFIEVKKKVLTRAAQSGNIASISTDLVKSFANAQIQANWHEIILRSEGALKFESGNTLKLNGRNIEKISLSMFDYMALHDGPTIHQIMNNLIGRELISDDKAVQSSLKSVNKSLSELNHQYSLPELSEYSKSKNAFFNCI